MTVISIKVEQKSSILIDLSKTGFQLIIPFSPQKEKVDIEFELKQKKFNFQGYIHWASRSILKLNWYQIGVSIIDPSDDFVNEIEKLLEIY